MNLHVVEKTISLAYDAAPLWPYQGPSSTDPFPIVDADVPPLLVHRRMWVGGFADIAGTGDSAPRFRLRVDLEGEDGTVIQWFNWITDYTLGLSSPPTGLGYVENFTSIRPPFVITNQFGDPDRGAPEHSGAYDARVMQYPAQVSAPDARNTRMTMFPVDLTARLRRVRFIISDFSVTGSITAGRIECGFRMQSQAFPF